MQSKTIISIKNNRLKEKKGDCQKVFTDRHTELPGFDSNNSDGVQDWKVIKAEIDNLLQNSRAGSELLQKSKEVSDYWNGVRVQMRRRG